MAEVFTLSARAVSAEPTAWRSNALHTTSSDGQAYPRWLALDHPLHMGCSAHQSMDIAEDVEPDIFTWGHGVSDARRAAAEPSAAVQRAWAAEASDQAAADPYGLAEMPASFSTGASAQSTGQLPPHAAGGASAAAPSAPAKASTFSEVWPATGELPWRAYAPDLHARTIHGLQGPWGARSLRGDGTTMPMEAGQAWRDADAQDDAEDSVRWWLERCDALGGIHVVLDSSEPLSGWALDLVAHLREEAPKAAALCTVLWDSPSAHMDTADVQARALSDTLLLSQVAELCTAVAPIAGPVSRAPPPFAWDRFQATPAVVGRGRAHHAAYQALAMLGMVTPWAMASPAAAHSRQPETVLRPSVPLPHVSAMGTLPQQALNTLVPFASMPVLSIGIAEVGPDLAGASSPANLITPECAALSVAWGAASAPVRTLATSASSAWHGAAPSAQSLVLADAGLRGAGGQADVLGKALFNMAAQSGAGVDCTRCWLAPDMQLPATWPAHCLARRGRLAGQPAHAVAAATATSVFNSAAALPAIRVLHHSADRARQSRVGAAAAARGVDIDLMRSSIDVVASWEDSYFSLPGGAELSDEIHFK